MESGTKDNPALAEQRLAYALEHPLRARMAAALRERPMDATELAAACGIRLRLAVYHYGVLRAAGGADTPL
jgi:DNA-binding transcriptional ArsR family regulator